MNILPLLLFGGVGLAITLLLIPLIRRRAVRMKPAETAWMFHQTHMAPVPRFGGLALAAALMTVAALAFVWFRGDSDLTATSLVIVFGSLAMFLIGFWDDVRPLGARKKLIGQVAVAVLVYAAGCQIDTFKNPLTGVVYDLQYMGMIATVLWLVALTNLINLIDGIDGLAGGLGLMMMLLLTYAAGGTHGFSVFVAAGMAGALAGFLRYNFPPAKIYLGDGGAYLIGFLIGILTIENSQKGTVLAMLVAPLFALALPIADVTLAIMRRGLKGLPIFRPDRGHLHHRLVTSGFSHRQAVLIFYGISLVFLLLSLGVLWSQGRWVPILFGFLCLTLLISARSFEFSREWFSLGRVLGNTLEMRKESEYALTLSRWLEMEAERCDTFDGLWEEFGFVARKLGFSRVKLTVNGGQGFWRADDADFAGDDEHCCTHELRIGGGMALEFNAERQAMNTRLFDHLADIAAEGWHKAAVRWQKLHERPLRFASGNRVWVGPRMPA
jgi:UDP-GlcNAc:undecaprenyl-phosphate/decaprenyl-phosphate GlcNAc-1-phosphate transferase